MARQEIILGTAPTGLGGDPPRTASTKINAMTQELYGITGSLGTASTYDVTSTADDPFVAPFKLLKQGDYGIGRALSGRILPNTATNRADVGLRGTGFSLDVLTGGDKPPTFGVGPMMTMNYSPDISVNIAYDWADGTVYTFPGAAAGQAKAWVKQYHANNVTGTMATGAIMERGSTTNGQWIKFSSGLMICWTPAVTPSLLNSSNIGVTWFYPASFISAPTVTANLTSVNIALGRVINGPHAISPSTTQSAIYLISQGSFVAGDVTGTSFQATATGWWK